MWSTNGQLLLKKGNPILSEQHRDRLAEFNAATTYDEGMAWQRAYERMVYALLRDGVGVQVKQAKAAVDEEAKPILKDLATFENGDGPCVEAQIAGFVERAVRP